MGVKVGTFHVRDLARPAENALRFPLLDDAVGSTRSGVSGTSSRCSLMMPTE